MKTTKSEVRPELTGQEHGRAKDGVSESKSPSGCDGASDTQTRPLDEYTLHRVIARLAVLKLKYEAVLLTFPKIGGIGSDAVQDSITAVERLMEDV
jgi:hypothetical protein